MIKAWEDEAWEDYLYWHANDKQTVKSIHRILLDIDRNGNSGVERPEPLKGELAGFFCRKIDDTNRLVYRLKVGRIEIIQCRSHYTQEKDAL